MPNSHAPISPGSRHLTPPFVAGLLAVSSATAGEWAWTLQENALALGVAKQQWTISDRYVANKLWFDAHYFAISNPAIDESDRKRVATHFHTHRAVFV